MSSDCVTAIQPGRQSKTLFKKERKRKKERRKKERRKEGRKEGKKETIVIKQAIHLMSEEDGVHHLSILFFPSLDKFIPMHQCRSCSRLGKEIQRCLLRALLELRALSQSLLNA